MESPKIKELAKLARSIGVRELELENKIPNNIPVKITGTDIVIDWLMLEDLYDDATFEVLNYCNREEPVRGMLPSIRDLAKIRYNQEGAEGEVSRSEGGVSQTYEEGIPRRIRSVLNRYRQARVRRLN